MASHVVVSGGAGIRLQLLRPTGPTCIPQAALPSVKTDSQEGSRGSLGKQMICHKLATAQASLEKAPFAVVLWQEQARIS